MYSSSDCPDRVPSPRFGFEVVTSSPFLDDPVRDVSGLEGSFGVFNWEPAPRTTYRGYRPVRYLQSTDLEFWLDTNLPHGSPDNGIALGRHHQCPLHDNHFMTVSALHRAPAVLRL